MQAPMIPLNEQQRLQALYDLEILDTHNEERFDRLTRMARQFCDVPTALISLIDANRQWFKSKQGLDACETSREISFCGHAILQKDIFYIPDATLDSRFADNPLVIDAPYIVAYAGVPLVLNNGYCVGTLCLIDYKARQFSAEQFQAMRDLAALVKQELELKEIFYRAQAFYESESRLHAVIDNVIDSIISIDEDGLIESTNPITETMFGYLAEELIGHPISQLILAPHLFDQFLTLPQHSAKSRTLSAIKKNGTVFPIEFSIKTMQLGERELFACFIRDISEFKTIEQALKDANRQNQSILDSANYSIISCDTQGIVRSFNKASQSMLGYSPDELIAKATPAIYLDANEIQARMILISKELNKTILNPLEGFVGRTRLGGVDEFECTYIRKDGTRIPVLLTVSALRDDDDLITGFLGIANDISHEKAAKAAAQESEARFRDLFDSANDLIQSVAADGRILYVNRAWLTSLKYEPEEVEGLYLDDIIAVDCQAQYQLVFQQVLAGIAIERIETTFIAKDSSRVIVEGSSNCQMVNGKAVATRSIFRDISQRKQQEQRILEQQKQLETALNQNQSILDNANYSIISTNTEGLILTFNKGAEAMLGYCATEIVYQASLDQFHDSAEMTARAKALSVELNQSINSGIDVLLAKAKLGLAEESEWTYRHKNGRPIPILLAVTAQKNSQGELIGFLGIASDITERKRIERMKNEFVSTVSHELRTPLTSIRGALGLVLGKASAGMSDKAKMLIETASRNSERLTLLINDILDLEKIESGNLAFNMQPTDLATIAKQAIIGNEGYALKHNVSLVLRQSLEQASIMGDEHRLLQVFSNLISNAVKYSYAQGVVEVALMQTKQSFRVSIKDYGQGIPEQFRAHIFSRFAQADSSDARAKNGTGLGLSITKAIVERHGGLLAYDTQEDVGTEFYFELPEWLEVRATVNDNRPKILICEDNTDAANVFAQLLHQEGIATDIVGTGNAARKLLAAYDYRALLLDLTLPDIDGLTLITELRADKRFVDLPIIVVSGRAEEGQHLLADEAVNVVDWLQKPVVHERLLRALQHVMVNKQRPRILHVEDDMSIIASTRTLILPTADYFYATTLASARKLLLTELFDMVMIDVVLPDGSGLDLLKEIGSDTQVLILSANDPHRQLAEQATAVLMKSRTSGTSLLAAIKEIIGVV